MQAIILSVQFGAALQTILMCTLVGASGTDASVDSQLCSQSTGGATTSRDISLIQAALLNNQVSATQLQGNSIRSQERAEKVFVKDREKIRAEAETVTASRSFLLMEGDIIDFQTPDIAVKVAENWKVIVFVAVLLVTVSVVVYFFVIRPKLQRKDAAAPETTSADDNGAAVGEMKFCPELVVPEGKECALVMPDKAVTSDAFPISDLNGGTVLQVTLESSDPWRVALKTEKGDVLAKCCAAPASTVGTREYHFLKVNDDYIAKLQLSNGSAEGKYSITWLNGVRMYMSVSLGQLVDFTSEDGKLLASSELMIASPTNGDTCGKLWLRVAPNSDAGLALCAMLCLGHYSRLLKRT